MYDYSLKEPLLTVNDLSVALGGRNVLGHLSLTVLDVHRPGHSQGQIVSLLGPSGVGKSILCRLIAGLDVCESGEIRVGLAQRPAEAGLVGLVMQHYPLLMHRKVRANLVLAAERNPTQGASAGQRALGLLEAFGIADLADAWPAQLSGGQRQRVAIAQQLLCSDHLLLMDEPTTGLDPVAKAKACELIQHVASLDEENTIVLVTHDIESAVRISDQVIVLGRNLGDPKAGACVRANIDLKARGIAWRPGNEALPAFRDTVREITALFSTL